MKENKNIHNNGGSLRNILLIVAAIALLPVLGSCSRKDADEYYHPSLNPDGIPIQNPGQAVVVIDELPQGYTGNAILASAAGTPYTLQSSTPIDVEAGHYAITVISHPTGETLPDALEVVPARPLANGRAEAAGRDEAVSRDEAETSSGLLRISPAADGSLISLPPISGATATIDIARDATAIANLTLHPLTREVLIIGLLQGLDPAAVSTLQATLYGLSNERGINQPFAGTTTAASSASSDAAVSGASGTTVSSGISSGAAATVAAAGNTVSYHLSAPFTLSADGTFSLAFRLLGTDPATSQRLRLTLTYRDPAAAPYVYEADVTPLLTGFNTGPAQQPAQLNATLSFGIDGISTTITGWTPGVDEDITGQ